jgi:hypothetical protein
LRCDRTQNHAGSLLSAWFLLRIALASMATESFKLNVLTDLGSLTEKAGIGIDYPEAR